MKKLVFLFIASIFLMGNCSKKNIRVVDSTYEDGQPKIVYFYKKLNGDREKVKRVEYHQNGQVKMEGHYKNGERNGSWTSYYKNGNVWSKATYKNGKANGVKKVFYENGDIYYQGRLENGERTGKWTFYDKEGKTTVIDYDKRR